MRKISQELMNAIQTRSSVGLQNTMTNYSLTKDATTVYLHGHEIAVVDYEKNEATVCFCGFNTNVTCSRINDVLQAIGKPDRFKIKDGEPMLLPSKKVFTLTEKIKI